MRQLAEVRKPFRYWGYAEPEELTIDAGETISFGWDAKRAENTAKMYVLRCN